MRHTLADSLEILLPSLSPTLVAPEVVPDLRRLARVLAPVPRGILECRLGPNAPQVDLSQCIHADDGEPAILAEHIAAAVSAGTLPDGPSWSRVRDFCSQWAKPSSPLHADIPDIWLEFDLDYPLSDLPTPSLFFTWRGDTLPTRESYAVVERTLSILLGESALGPLKDNLHRCFDACADAARVISVGVMLSRQTEALRVNVKPLGSDRIVPYLERAGWPGPAEEFRHLIVQMGGFADYMMVDMDVGTRICQEVGLECRPIQQPARGPQWATFLDHLLESGLCTPQKRDALLAWPGRIDPTSSPAPWPDHLIVESLLQPADHFSAFLRRVSHAKIVYSPQRPLEAKGYLWFGHTWLRLQPVQGTSNEG
jgi:hypothetical protein